MLMSTASTKLGLTGITPPTQQKPTGKNPAYEEGVKKIAKERLDTVKYLRETEARIRTVQDVLKEVGTETTFGKQQKAQLDQLLSDQATYNKKIKFLDSRLKDPKLVSTYVETKQPIPQELKPTFGQEVLLGEKAWQKELVAGQNKYQKMADDALETLGFKYVPEGIIKDITKGLLNPLSATENLVKAIGTPTKFMDTTFYDITRNDATPAERATAGLNFAFLALALVPGATAAKKGVFEMADEAIENAFRKGVNIQKVVENLKLAPQKTKEILTRVGDVSKKIGVSLAESGAQAVASGKALGAKAVEGAKKVAKGVKDISKEIEVKMPSGAFSSAGLPPLPSVKVSPGLKQKISQRIFGFTDEEAKDINKLLGTDIERTILPLEKTKISDTLRNMKIDVKDDNVSLMTQFDLLFRDLTQGINHRKQKGGYIFGGRAFKNFDIFDKNNNFTNEYIDNVTQEMSTYFRQNFNRDDVKDLLIKVKDLSDKGELIFKDARVFVFPKQLQDDIVKRIQSKGAPPNLLDKISSVIKGKITGVTGTEKRLLQRDFPEAFPTINLTTEAIAGLNKKIKNTLEEVKTGADELLSKGNYLDVFKKLSSDTKYQPELDRLRNVMTNFKGGAIWQEFKKIADDVNVSNETRDFARLMENQVKNQFFTRKDFKDAIKQDETILDYLFRIGGDKDEKIFSLGKLKDLYQKDKAAVEKNLDPVALAYEMIAKGGQVEALEPAIMGREIISDFLKTQLDTLGDKATPQQKNFINSFTNVFEQINTQVKKEFSQFDIEAEKTLGSTVLNIANVLSKGAGRSMIAGNVSSAFSQLAPLVWNAALQGIVPATKGTLDAIRAALPIEKLRNVAANDIRDAWTKSNFLTNREGNEALQKQMDNLLGKNFLGSSLGDKAIVKQYLQAKNVWGNAVDKLTKITMSAVDDVVSKTIYTTAYSKGIAAGLTKEQAIKNADLIAEKIISGRAPGDYPVLMTPQVMKSILQFQLEVLNQPSLLRDLARTGAGENDKLINSVGNLLIKGGKYLTLAYLANNVIERVNGRRPALDFVGMVEDFYKAKDQTTQPLLPGGRLPSKTYAKDDPVGLAEKIYEQTFGSVTKAEITSSPAYALIKEISKASIALTDADRMNKEAATRESAIKIGSLLLKGGNQLRKFYTGFSALSPEGYTDESKVKIADEIGELEQQIARENEGRKLSERIVVSDDAIDKIRAIFLGAGGTRAALEKQANKQQAFFELRRLQKELDETTNPAQRKILRKQLDADREDFRQTYGTIKQ